MTMILRQSTAVTVPIGPFVDSNNAYDAETGLSPSVKLKKNGGTAAVKNEGTTPSHDADGYYDCDLDATDTNTVGTLVLYVAGSATALGVRHEFQVVEEAVYDAMYAASAAGPLQSTTAGRTLDVTATGAAGIDWGNVENQGTAVDLSSTQVSTVDALSTGAIQATTIASNAITADKIAADAIGSSELATTAANKIRDAILSDSTPFAGANVDAAVTSRATPAQVNTEVLDVMNTDTITLPGQEAPPLAPTHRQAIGWLYKVLRNRKSQTATQWSLYADNESTVDAKATVSDDATTAIKQEIVSGP